MTADKQSNTIPVSILNQVKRKKKNNWSQVQGNFKAIWQLNVLPDSWTSLRSSVVEPIFQFPWKDETQSK